MTVGVVRETAPGERRALVPKVAASLVGKGVPVVVESGAGLGALIPDEAYTEVGATIGDPYSADVVLRVSPPSDEEIAKLRSGQKHRLPGPAQCRQQDRCPEEAGVEAYAVEAISRISRAQVMDALSSQANVAGYKAVIVAADLSTRSSRC